MHWKLKMIIFDFSQIGTSWIRNQQTQSHVCRRGWEGFHWRTLWTNLRIRRLRPISGHWCHAKDLTFASSYKLGFIWKYTTFECGHWHWFFILLNIFSKLQILIITANNSRKIRLHNSIGNSDSEWFWTMYISLSFLARVHYGFFHLHFLNLLH